MDATKRSQLIEQLLPVTLVLLVLLVCLVTLYPFLPAFLWGAMVAIAVDPSYRKLVHKLGGRRKLAAFLTGVFLSVAFVVPIIGLAMALLAFLPDAIVWIEGFAVGMPDDPPDPFVSIPAIGPKIRDLWHSLFTDTANFASHFGQEFKTFLVWFFGEAELLGLFVFEFAIGVVLAVIFVYNAESISRLSRKFFDKIGGEFVDREQCSFFRQRLISG
jgi:predicted PurR-regulated permease PerM